MEGAGVPQVGARYALRRDVGPCGFENLEAEATVLSGRLQKRLAIVEALVQKPDILCWTSLPIIGSRRNRVARKLAPCIAIACVVVSS